MLLHGGSSFACDHFLQHELRQGDTRTALAIQSTFCLRSKGPVFPNGKGNAADPDSFRASCNPALAVCGYCSKTKGEHTAEGHKYERNDVLPKWHGWHAFRRGLASVLYGLGADDLTVQRILRHSKVTVTREHSIKTPDEKAQAAMQKLETALHDTYVTPRKPLTDTKTVI